jgi:hypothetical protein
MTTPNHVSAALTPGQRRPRRSVFSYAGPLVMFAGVSAVAFALFALVSQVALARSVGGGAADPVVYPAKGQSAQEQSKDRFECYEWARSQSGFDPAQAQDTAARPAASGQGSKTGSMVGGAIGGAAVAEVTHHDAGRGAAIGALGGGVRERMREKQAAQAMQQQAAQQQAGRANQKAVYDRAFGACMEARGYTVR